MGGSKINTLTVHGSHSALVNRSNIILISLIAHWIRACVQIKCVFSHPVLIPVVFCVMDDFLIFWNNANPGRRVGCTAPKILWCALGHRAVREGGRGSAVRGLAQSFLKSILALQALDNLENIIQNSPFQHVSAMKGCFHSASAQCWCDPGMHR